MGSRYLTDLADVCRAAGLTTTEVGGSPSQTGTQWQNRSRSSGGYNSGLPDAVMVHHTASGASADGWSDVNYCTFSSENRPVCNLYLSRQGQVWVCAGGATNTNGSGGPIGPVPQDSMNTHAIGIEAGNNGTGEPWPDVMQDAYVRLCNALCNHYAIPVGQVYSHAEYAPSRKIDPAGPSRWASSGTWPMDPFRSDVATAGGGGGTPERKVKMYGIYVTPEDGGVWASDMLHARWLMTARAIQHYQAMLTFFGFNPNPVGVAQQEVKDGVYGIPIGPLPWDGARDATALNFLYCVLGGYDQPNQALWHHILQTESAAKQAATNTMPAGQTFAVPDEDAVPDA